MIVVKDGSMTTPWWINQIAKCKMCGAEYQLEESDKHAAYFWSMVVTPKGRTVAVDCQFCQTPAGAEVEIEVFK